MTTQSGQFANSNATFEANLYAQAQKGEGRILARAAHPRAERRVGVDLDGRRAADHHDGHRRRHERGHLTAGELRQRRRHITWPCAARNAGIPAPIAKPKTTTPIAIGMTGKLRDPRVGNGGVLGVMRLPIRDQFASSEQAALQIEAVEG